MTRKYFHSNRLRHAIPFAAASFTVGLALFACSDKDIDSNENNGKALVVFNVSEKQDQAQAAAKSNQPMTRAAFTHQLALQNLAPEDLTMQKLPVQGAAASSDICLIETTVPGLPSQWEDDAPTRANITTMPTMQNFSTTAFYGYSDTSLAPWFYDKDTKKDGTLVTPIYWDWVKTHACFYAVYPKPDNSKIKLSPEGYTSTPYVDFEVEPNVKNQKDLMTACSGPVHSTVTNISAVETQATAPRTDLTFRHALTAVRFKVGSNLSWNKTIDKVEIRGAKSKGRYTLSSQYDGTGAAWSDQSTPATFTLGGDGTVNVSTSAAVNNIIMGNTGDNYTFYMIPQTLTGVQVKVFFSDGSTPITATLTGQWKPGTTKTYALSQNTSTWNYVLTVTPPSAIAYDQTTTGNYTIQSYRQDPATSTQQSVAWKVVSYQESTDGGVTFGLETSSKPAWLTALSIENGNGSISGGEYGNATVKKEIIDRLAPYNQVLSTATPKGSAGNYYNLSNATGAAAIENTANSYLISAPGYYRIPLVYGNAIKNGTTNSHAYQTSVSGTYVLQHFKDYVNQDITDPWITQSNWGATAPDGAKLVWADESGLVTNLGLTGSGTNAFVQFEVPANKIKNGNAVIAVTKFGTVVWSWHLWFIHDDALNTVTCTNFQDHKYKFTQETLGWKYTALKVSTYSAPRKVRMKVEQTVANGGVKQSAYITITQNPGNARQGYSTFYQFGRKDAFPGTDTTPDGSFNKNGNNNMSATNGIQHPETFYTWGSTWYSGYNWVNLWSMDNTTGGHNDKPVVKTIYDPCPAGFHMPASNAFTGFTTTGQSTSTQSEFNVSGDWDMGWNFKAGGSSTATVYFPASGFRVYNVGSLSLVGVYGYYWSAVPNGTYYGCGLYFNSGDVNPRINSNRSYGFSVRPVAEPKTRVTPKLPGSTEEDWSSNEDLDGGDIDI